MRTVWCDGATTALAALGTFLFVCGNIVAIVRTSTATPRVPTARLVSKCNVRPGKQHLRRLSTPSIQRRRAVGGGTYRFRPWQGGRRGVAPRGATVKQPDSSSGSGRQALVLFLRVRVRAYAAGTHGGRATRALVSEAAAHCFAQRG